MSKLLTFVALLLAIGTAGAARPSADLQWMGTDGVKRFMWMEQVDIHSAGWPFANTDDPRVWVEQPSTGDRLPFDGSAPLQYTAGDGTVKAIQKIRCRLTLPGPQLPIWCVFVLPDGKETTHIDVLNWDRKPQRAYIRNVERIHGPLPQRPVFMLE